MWTCPGGYENAPPAPPKPPRPVSALRRPPPPPPPPPPFPPLSLACSCSVYPECLSGNVDVSERCGCGDYGSSGSHHGRRLGGSHGSRRKPICYVRDPNQCELESPGRARWSNWRDGISYRE